MAEEKAEVPARIDRAASALVDGLLKVVDDGLGPIPGARAYAEDRLRLTEGDVERAIKRIVRESIAASGSAGFATGVGGFVTLPITLPANIAGQAAINARMVASIAHLRGWDIQDELVRNGILITVAGGNSKDAFRAVAVNVAGKVAQNTIKQIPMSVIRDINRRAGFMLVAKYGTQRSAVTLAKVVPAVGGIVGGSVDAAFTKAASTAAKRAFPNRSSSVDTYAEVIWDNTVPEASPTVGE